MHSAMPQINPDDPRSNKISVVLNRQFAPDIYGSEFRALEIARSYPDAPYLGFLSARDPRLHKPSTSPHMQRALRPHAVRQRVDDGGGVSGAAPANIREHPCEARAPPRRRGPGSPTLGPTRRWSAVRLTSSSRSAVAGLRARARRGLRRRDGSARPRLTCRARRHGARCRPPGHGGIHPCPPARVADPSLVDR